MLDEAVQAEAISDSGSAVRGAVYTPPSLAEWVAGMVAEHIDSPATVVDLACGRGALLAPLAKRDSRLRLVGVDISAADLSLASEEVPSARFIHADALLPEVPVGNVAEIPQALGMDQVDGIVLNPPWGVDLPHTAAELRDRGYRLARGQFDSAGLFVELALSSLAVGGVAGMILPDSIFFPGHSPLRRMLIEETELLLVSRLGEGFFPGVFRGTAVVVARKRSPGPRHAVACMALSPPKRRAVLEGTETLDSLARREAHLVPQSRFARTQSVDFDISVKDGHVAFVDQMRQQAGAWTEWFQSGRGVELSKHGGIVSCPDCGFSRPRPRKTALVHCGHCGAVSSLSELQEQTIVRSLGRPGRLWAPLVSGEDVRRYRAVASREIRTGVRGINYKPGHQVAGERILVRKTGIGIRAAMIEEEAYITQVVFSYRPVPEAPPFYARYALGLLCSRAMLAFHLLISGESQWRSHPYVTQRVIDALPIPVPSPGTPEWARAQSIAQLAGDLMSGRGGEALDFQLEGLVAGLYGLSDSDVAMIADVFEDAQDLDGIRDMRFDPRRIASVSV